MSRIKKYLKTFPFLVTTKQILWGWVGLSRVNPILYDRKFFMKRFASSPNINSLSFERGIVLGKFQNTSFILRIRPKNFIESFVYLNGIWEPRIANLIASYLDDSDAVMIDVGANIGATSIPLAKHFNNVKFFLFEPHPTVFKDLTDNLKFNKITNAVAKNVAITNEFDQTLPFYAQKDATNFGLSSFTLNHDIQDYDVIEVECSRLDAIVDNNLNVRVIKIDTQGYELNVLLSAKKIISKHRPIIFFEFESEYFKTNVREEKTKEALKEFFNSLNYELYMISHEDNFFPELMLSDYFHGDIIALPLDPEITSK